MKNLNYDGYKMIIKMLYQKRGLSKKKDLHNHVQKVNVARQNEQYYHNAINSCIRHCTMLHLFDDL